MSDEVQTSAHPFPEFPMIEHTALSMPGKGSTTELTSSPQTRFHHLDTLYSLLSSAAQLQSLSWKTDRLAPLGYQAVPHSKVSSSLANIFADSAPEAISGNNRSTVYKGLSFSDSAS